MTKEELIKTLQASVIEKYNELKKGGQDPVTDDTLRNLINEQLSKMQELPSRGGEFNLVEDKDLNKESDDPLKGVKVQYDDKILVDAKMALPSHELKDYYSAGLVDKLESFKKLNDDLYLIGTMLTGAANKNQFTRTFADVCRGTKTFKKIQARLKSDEELRKALYSDGTGVGDEWVPTGWSSQLLEKIRLARKVEAIFPAMPMPTNPYTVPVETAGATGYLVSESNADEATKLPASTPTTSNFSFTAKKLAGRVVFSDEINEDAIVNILGFVRDSLTTAIGEASEKAIINGDDSTTHQDSNVTTSTDAQKAFKGLRYYAINNAGTATKDASNANLSTTLIRATRMLMGKHAVDPTKLYYIGSPIGYINFLGISEVLTLDKYGPNATILRGEIGKLDGSSIIISEFMYDNLNASGVYDGSTTNRTAIVLVFAPAFWVGNRAGITLASERLIQTDQLVVVAKRRIAFEDPYDATSASNIQSAYLYNVKTTL